MTNISPRNKASIELALRTEVLATGMNAMNLHLLANGHQVLVLPSY